mgnify:CR=1 FL=1
MPYMNGMNFHQHAVRASDRDQAQQAENQK